jgi:hypothetical protein
MARNKCCTSKKHYQERGASGKACEGQCEEHQEQHAKEGSTSGTACQGTSAVHQEKLARNNVRNIRTRMYRNKLRCIMNRMPVNIINSMPTTSAERQEQHAKEQGEYIKDMQHAQELYEGDLRSGQALLHINNKSNKSFWSLCKLHKELKFRIFSFIEHSIELVCLFSSFVQDFLGPKM